MIYGVKYNIEKNEFYTISANVHKEWGINFEPFWIDDENIFVCFEAKSLEEANRIAADKICKYFDRKREEALEEAAKYTLEVSKYEKLARAVKYAEFVVDGKKKIYSVCYFADDGDEISARELPDEDDQIVCDKVYRTQELMYEVFVEAADEKEAKTKGAECIAKFIEDKKQEVSRQIDELSNIEEDMSDMVAWLRSKVEQLRRT